VTVSAPGFEPVVSRGVDPRRGALTIRMSEVAPPRSARIIGTVLTADGLPPGQVTLTARERGGESADGAADDIGRFALGPLRAGTWKLRIEAPGHPVIVTGWRDVAAQEECDLGTLWLPAGGAILATVRAPAGLSPHLAVADASLCLWTGFDGDGVERRSKPLPPGPHFVSVGGAGIAAQLVPVEVAAHEDRPIEIVAVRGWLQRFEFTSPRR